MKTLLWLGAGDIASRFCDQFDWQRWRMITLSRRTTSMHSQSEFHIVGDAHQSKNVRQGLEHIPDVIVCSFTPKEFSDAAYQLSYVESAITLANELKQNGQNPLVVWISSTSVFGDSRGNWVDENTPVTPNTFSGQRLYKAETIISHIDNHCIVRFSGIYGAGRERLIEQVRQGYQVPAEPKQWSNRIHSDDCGGIIAHLIQRWQQGKEVANCYIGSDCLPTPSYEVRQWLAEQLNATLDKTAPPSRMQANRRCNNNLLVEHGYQFIYPTFKEGYTQVLANYDC